MLTICVRACQKCTIAAIILMNPSCPNAECQQLQLQPDVSNLHEQGRGGTKLILRPSPGQATVLGQQRLSSCATARQEPMHTRKIIRIAMQQRHNSFRAGGGARMASSPSECPLRLSTRALRNRSACIALRSSFCSARALRIRSAFAGHVHDLVPTHVSLSLVHP